MAVAVLLVLAASIWLIPGASDPQAAEPESQGTDTQADGLESSDLGEARTDAGVAVAESTDELGPGASSTTSQPFVSWEKAKASLRDMSASWLPEDTEDIQRMALQWPRNVCGDLPRGKRDKPIYESPALNPEGKELGPLHLEELDGIVTEYNGQLEVLADDGAELCRTALLSYFDAEMFEGYSATMLPEKGGLITRGRYHRNSTIESNGWIVRTRFTSEDFPAVEDHLASMLLLKEERAEAVRKYIEGIRE